MGYASKLYQWTDSPLIGPWDSGYDYSRFDWDKERERSSSESDSRAGSTSGATFTYSSYSNSSSRDDSSHFDGELYFESTGLFGATWSRQTLVFDETMDYDYTAGPTDYSVSIAYEAPWTLVQTGTFFFTPWTTTGTETQGHTETREPAKLPPVPVAVQPKLEEAKAPEYYGFGAAVIASYADGPDGDGIVAVPIAPPGTSHLGIPLQQTTVPPASSPTKPSQSLGLPVDDEESRAKLLAQLTSKINERQRRPDHDPNSSESRRLAELYDRVRNDRKNFIVDSNGNLIAITQKGQTDLDTSAGLNDFLNLSPVDKMVEALTLAATIAPGKFVDSLLAIVKVLKTPEGASLAVLLTAAGAMGGAPAGMAAAILGGFGIFGAGVDIADVLLGLDKAANASSRADIIDASDRIAQGLGSGTVSIAGLAVARFVKSLNCFPKDTLVTTETGLRPIHQVVAGDKVWSFDFLKGTWRLCQVEIRHDNPFEGLLVTITTDHGSVTSTEFHPFWVVRGKELYRRTVCRELAEKEDQGGKLEGRWVNSHELQEGDVVYLRGRGATTVRKLDLQQIRTEVCNLTVSELHTFAVGTEGFLVHNLSGTISIREGHHLLPKEFISQFNRVGLDIEEFVIPMDQARHRFKPNGLHTTSGGNWNKVWGEFFSRNPNASKQEIIEQLYKMLKDFKLV